jgi:hypothetical protein
MDTMIKTHIMLSVLSFPFCSIEAVRVFLIKLRTGLPDCFVNSESVPEPTLNINSRKGISMPIDTIEKMMERTVNRKYRKI